eukprot:4376192-Pleurochrysis_carterae.AAC.1
MHKLLFIYVHRTLCAPYAPRRAPIGASILTVEPTRYDRACADARVCCLRSQAVGIALYGRSSRKSVRSPGEGPLRSVPPASGIANT